MHITTEYTIWCARCDHWRRGTARNKAVYAKAMAVAGWRTRKGKTVCSACVVELKAGKDWEDIGYRRYADDNNENGG